MDLVLFNILTVIIMKDIGSKMKGIIKDFIYGLMVINMKENIKMIIDMAKESLNI